MQIEESQYASMISSFYDKPLQQTNKLGKQSLPSTEDTVSISEEGFALAQKMWAERFTEGMTIIEGEETSSDETSDSDTSRSEFAEYMSEAKGEASGDAATPEEQIEKLEKKIKQLQNQLVTIEASNVPGETKDQKGEGIRQTIEGLQKQIANILKGAVA